MGGYLEWDMTNETRFTPGPWDYCKPHKRWLVYPESARDGGIDYYIAEAINVDGRFAEAKANAHLIAAAPEMYAALEAFAEAAKNLEDRQRDHDHLWESPEAMMLTAGDLRRALAALRKARGEQ